jgi:hypothetical protein
LENAKKCQTLLIKIFNKFVLKVEKKRFSFKFSMVAARYGGNGRALCSELTQGGVEWSL